jgi:hypothetical protein
MKPNTTPTRAARQSTVTGSPVQTKFLEAYTTQQLPRIGCGALKPEARYGTAQHGMGNTTTATASKMGKLFAFSFSSLSLSRHLVPIFSLASLKKSTRQ